MSIWRKQDGKMEQVVAENEEALARNPQDLVARAKSALVRLFEEQGRMHELKF